MTRVRTGTEGEPAEVRFELHEWFSAVISLAAVLAGAVVLLGLTYLLVAIR